MNWSAASLFEDPAEASPPTMRALGWLMERGATLAAVTQPWAVHIGTVTFDGPWTYRPATAGERAFVFAIIDAGEIVDIAAWAPRLDRIGTRLGIGSAIGQGQIEHDGSDAATAALPIRRDPLDWLRSDRKGIVIADQPKAALLLAGRAVVAEEVQHAKALRQALAVPKPKIMVHAPIDWSMAA